MPPPPMAFTDVPRADAQALLSNPSPEQVRAILSRCLGVPVDESDRAEVMREFHRHNIAFARRAGFGAEQMSTFLSIMREAFGYVTEQGMGGGPETQALLGELVERHSWHLPPYSYGIYSRREAAAVLDHAARSLLRLAKMYAFACSQRQDDRALDLGPLRTVPPIPAPVDLHPVHEVDPWDIPELLDHLRRSGAALPAHRPVNAQGAT